MKTHRQTACFAALLFSLFQTASTPGATEPSVSAAELPRVPALEPAEALKSFVVKPGFHLEITAAEPLVVDPVAMSFDESGRLFVVEMRDYSERRDERLGRIRLLTDTNYDGRFDTSVVYADNLGWPTAVICYDGGVFVGCTPDILYFKDTNGDGVADERKVVFTGFGVTQERLNVQGMLNSFNWGLDNRIHGATGLNGGRIKILADPDAPPVELRGKDFSFDPRDLRHIRPESGGGQHGLTFDNAGRKFVCHNSRHIIQVMYDDYYAGRNPNYSLPPPLLDIAVDGPAAEVFRLSPDEPWRVIRTKWRVAGQVPGPIEGGGRASGYFTSATGITIYRGNAFPEEYAGDAFIADVGSNLIHRKKLRPNGVAFNAGRPADEQKTEFIASRDLWFRPVQFANAPDGTLYLADMYREVIEHPWSIPESIKKHLDLNSGNDRGRIYRIVPDGFKQPAPPNLAKASTAELAKMLEHPSGWHRDTAARLLYERREAAAVGLIESVLKNSKQPHGRLHALYALLGQNALQPKHVEHALADGDPQVRAHAVRLSEARFIGDPTAASLSQKAAPAARDESPYVRYQAAFTAGERQPLPLDQLVFLARSKADDPWIDAALLNSLSKDAATLFMRFINEKGAAQPSERFLRQLAQLIGRQNTGIERVAQEIVQLGDTGRACSLAAALAEGLQVDKRDTSNLRTKLEPLRARARDLAASARADEVQRTPAIAFLAFSSFEESGALLRDLLDSKNSPAIQVAAISALDRFDDPRVADAVLALWPTLSPRVRTEAAGMLIKRSQRATKLLDAIERGAIQPGELSSTHAKFLQKHPERSIREAAARLLPVSTARRDDVVQSFQNAVALKGDAGHGKTLYLERCSSCHRLSGQGFQLGPDLETVKTTGKEKLLINILDPNREVPPNYTSYLIETKDGETLMGLVAHETPSSVTVRQAYGKEEVVPRSQIVKMQTQGQSLMPEGVEAGLTAKDLADLLEYLAN